MEQENLTEEGQQPNAVSRPAAKFGGTGGLQIAVWKEKTDEGRDRYSVKADRSYKDADGSYHSTGYFRDVDLLRLTKLLDQADAWIEQDKAKNRGAQSASASGR